MPYIRFPHNAESDWLLSNCEIVIPLDSLTGMTAEDIGICVQAIAEFSKKIPEVFYYEHSMADIDEALTFLEYYKPEIPHAQRKLIRYELTLQYKTLFKALIERDGKQCGGCGTTERLNIDHIMPVSRGGTNDLDNLRLLCRPCNSKKSNKIEKG